MNNTKASHNNNVTSLTKARSGKPTSLICSSWVITDSMEKGSFYCITMVRLNAVATPRRGARNPRICVAQVAPCRWNRNRMGAVCLVPRTQSIQTTKPEREGVSFKTEHAKCLGSTQKYKWKQQGSTSNQAVVRDTGRGSSEDGYSGWERWENTGE